MPHANAVPRHAMHRSRETVQRIGIVDRKPYNGVFHPARHKAGRPDLRFHDLRHTGAVLAAATGATLAELMARLGHSTPAAAMRYQHASADRDRAIAEKLSGLATAHASARAGPQVGVRRGRSAVADPGGS